MASTPSSSNKIDEVVMAVQCQYPNRICHQPVITNYNYCSRHILEDKTAPFRPCSFTYPNTNKKCPLAAPKGDKRDSGYCKMHLWKLLLKRQNSSAKNVPPVTTETLFTELSHYVRPVRNAWNKNSSSEKHDPNVTNALNPFVEVDVSKAWLRRAQVLECASESDSDCEPATLDNVCRALHEESSDAESIDSQMDDPLRYSGTFTAEEAALLARNKMMRLQMLYQKQFDKIITTLKEKRRIYLLASKKEKEMYCSISDQCKNSIKEKKMYEKLRALKGYHKKSSRDILAYHNSMEKKSGQSGSSKSPGSKCTYTEGGVRCCGPTLPLTKFCFKHILQDPNQCIFRACGCVKADSFCQEPVVELTNDETCLLHFRLPVLPHLPSTSATDFINHDKTMEGESELDASATESAVSTDNGISNEDAINLETTIMDPSDHKSEHFINGSHIDPSSSFDSDVKPCMKPGINIKRELQSSKQISILKNRQEMSRIVPERMPLTLESLPIKQEMSVSPGPSTVHYPQASTSQIKLSPSVMETEDPLIGEPVEVGGEFVVIG